MTSQPGKQTIAIYIMLNISIGKGSQTMKFGQLIEYSMRNILKVSGETISRPIFKKSKLSISLDQ